MGGVTTIPASSIVPYDNTDSDLSSTTVKTALDELSNSAIWTSTTVNGLATSTFVADTVALSTFNRISYIISIKSTTGIKSFNMSVFKVGASVSDSIYNRYDNGLDVEVNAIISGSDAQLEIVNNEAEGIEVNFLRAYN